MKKVITTALFALTLGTTLVLADDTSMTKLDINKALPQSITVLDAPVLPQENKEIVVRYSPLQKASLVELKLTATEASLLDNPVTEQTKYSPLQKARIVELELTAE